MELKQIQKIVKEATKGANIRLAWNRICKTKKTCFDDIRKSVKTVGRIGIDYNNQKVVKDKRESGELPEESQTIWNGKGQWFEYPYLLRHTGTDQKYLRLYKGISDPPAKTTYYRNNQEVPFENVENDLLASEKKHSSESDCICCKIENITDISWNKSFK